MNTLHPLTCHSTAARAAHCTVTDNSVAGAFGGRSTVGPVNDIDDVDAAVGCERELLDPVCRVDPARVAALLADDFVEIGKSGRVCSRDDIVAALAAEPGMDGITIGPMSGQRITAGLVVASTPQAPLLRLLFVGLAALTLPHMIVVMLSERRGPAPP